MGINSEINNTLFARRTRRCILSIINFPFLGIEDTRSYLKSPKNAFPFVLARRAAAIKICKNVRILNACIAFINPIITFRRCLEFRSRFSGPRGSGRTHFANTLSAQFMAAAYCRKRYCRSRVSSSRNQSFSDGRRLLKFTFALLHAIGCDAGTERNRPAAGT